MEKVIWDEQFNIGAEVVDKAHAKLFRIIGKLIDLSVDPQKYQSTYKEGVKYLEDYSMKHFSEEEAFMRSIKYGGYARHKQIHDTFRDKTLVSLKKDLTLSNYSSLSVQRFVGTMTGWLTGHIMTEDQAIVGKVSTKKIFDYSSQVSTISKAVNRAMLDVFRIEAKLVSANYKGQNIGNGFYCRLLYDIEGGSRLQLLLGVEEPLILRGVGQMLGMKQIQSGEIANEASLQVFNLLFQHMGRMFRTEKEHELDKNDLLTRDEFRADFMKGYPCSLLFSTKLGYFIFCFRSWRIKSQKIENTAGKDESGTCGLPNSGKNTKS